MAYKPLRAERPEQGGSTPELSPETLRLVGGTAMPPAAKETYTFYIREDSQQLVIPRYGYNFDSVAVEVQADLA